MTYSPTTFWGCTSAALFAATMSLVTIAPEQHTAIMVLTVLTAAAKAVQAQLTPDKPVAQVAGEVVTPVVANDEGTLMTKASPSEPETKESHT